MMVAGFIAMLSTSVTVEQRVMSNARTVHLSATGAWLQRFDAWSSPGVGATVTHYIGQTFALDYLSGQYFFTYETEQAAAVRVATGFVSNRERPRALIGIGARYAFAYGKLLLEAPGVVVHFVPEISLHVGGMLTHLALRPAFDAGIGLRVRAGSHVEISFEYQFVGSLEGGRFIPGGMPRLSLGFAL